eukprot:5489172-Pleurochrysis_carterae.AAC.2
MYSYRPLVGALLYYSTQTRRDVAYAVGMLCRAMSCFTNEFLDAARRVLMYLSLLRDIGLRFIRSVRPVHGYSDSDWAPDTPLPATYSCTIKRPFHGLSRNNLLSPSPNAKRKSLPPRKRLRKLFTYVHSSYEDLGLPAADPTSLSLVRQQIHDRPGLQSRTSSAVKIH